MKLNTDPITPADMREIHEKTMALAQAARDAELQGDHELAAKYRAAIDALYEAAERKLEAQPA